MRRSEFGLGGKQVETPKLRASFEWASAGQRAVRGWRAASELGGRLQLPRGCGLVARTYALFDPVVFFLINS